MCHLEDTATPIQLGRARLIQPFLPKYPLWPRSRQHCVLKICEKAKQLQMSSCSWKLLCTGCLRGKQVFSYTFEKVISAAALHKILRNVKRLRQGAEVLAKLQLGGPQLIILAVNISGGALHKHPRFISYPT